MADENDSGMRPFWVDRQRVKLEAGAGLFSPSLDKLSRFIRWLYGPDGFASPIGRIRYSQSIITRSESELLGISSPRFAFRAELGRCGFINIRRRVKMFDAIEAIDADADRQRPLAKGFLAGNGDQESANWIADCLLVPPPRLDGYTILNCQMHEDYGEVDLEHVSPFVTHVDFGGGLCAQAACFMALGLANCQRIYGIAEITSQAMLDQQSHVENAFRVRGLSPPQIVRFLQDQQTSGVTAQRQGLVEDKPLIVERVGVTLRAYLANKIPVIAIVALTRMIGQSDPDEPAITPIIQCGDKDVDHDDYGYLPIGHSATPDPDPNLCHSVVIVGYSSDQFVMHDPASFPFITCSDEQLCRIRPQKPMLSKQVPGGGTIKRRFVQFISVTPATVRLTLLRQNFMSGGGAVRRESDGLLEMIEAQLSDTRSFGLHAVDLDTPGWMSGTIHLVQWNELGFQFVSKRDPEFRLPKVVASRLQQLRTDVFWLHQVSVIDTRTEPSRHVNSLWFWDATATRTPFRPIVFVQRGDTFVERSEQPA